MDQISTYHIAFSSSGITTSLKCALARTCPSWKISFSHNSTQDSGLWQNIYLSLTTDGRNPFSREPPCAPNMTDPGSADSNDATFLATCVCCSSLNKWKKKDVCIAETRPSKGVRLFRLERGGKSAMASAWPESSIRKSLSKISPGMNVAGKISLLSLKSWCPNSQNSRSKP